MFAFSSWTHFPLFMVSCDNGHIILLSTKCVMILNRICLTIYATNQSQSQRTLNNFSSTIIYLGLCFKSQKCKTTVITWLNEMWQTQNSHNILCLYLRFDIRILLLYPPIYRWSSSKLYQRCVGFTQTPGRWCH